MSKNRLGTFRDTSYLVAPDLSPYLYSSDSETYQFGDLVLGGRSATYPSTLSLGPGRT